jgi:hypothetical protein
MEAASLGHSRQCPGQRENVPRVTGLAGHLSRVLLVSFATWIPMPAWAFVVSISAGPEAIFLQVGTGSFSGLYSGRHAAEQPDGERRLGDRAERARCCPVRTSR